MIKAIAMIADGTEEVECLGVVDILRRAGVQTSLVAVGGKTIVSSHGVTITADKTVDEVDFGEADLIFVAGGLPGTRNLAACKPLINGIKQALSDGRRVAAICAAPALVLGANGFLKGKKAACYPGFEDNMTGAQIQSSARVVTDGNVTTARGLGCTIELGLELVRLLIGDGQADEIKDKIQF